MSNEVADVLDDAADYIEKHGWHQGSYESPTGEVCAMGAIHQVADGSYEWLDVTMRIAMPLTAHLGMPVATWNDAPERTKQEVLDAFRSAAKSERRKADGLVDA